MPEIYSRIAQESGYTFEYIDAGGSNKQEHLAKNKLIKKVREKLKIKDEITWYSARGTFISKMIDEGFHPMQVAQFAGNSPDMIYRHYYKNTDPKSTLENLNRIF